MSEELYPPDGIAHSHKLPELLETSGLDDSQRRHSKQSDLLENSRVDRRGRACTYVLTHKLVAGRPTPRRD
jgi:hypothetical protein